MSGFPLLLGSNPPATPPTPPSAGRPAYRLVLAERSETGLGSSIISDVFGTIGFNRRAEPLRWTEDIRGGPEVIEFSLPIDHASVTHANFAVGKRELYLYRDSGAGEVLVWGGRLQVADVQGWFVRFAGYGFWNDFSRRHVEDDYASKPATPKDQYKIVHQLVAYTQGQEGDPWASVGGSNGRGLGIVEFENYNAVTSGVTRKLIVCAQERRQLDDVFDELADAEDGFDIAVLPNKTLRLWSPRRGSATPVLTFDAGDNVSDFGYQDSATEVATQVAGIGEQADCAVANVYITSNTPAIDAFGLLHEAVTPENVRDDDAWVAKQADEYLRNHLVSRLQPKIGTQSGIQELPFVTGIALDAYEVGDVVTLVATRGPVGGFGQFSQNFRVIGREVVVDAAGYEAVGAILDQVTA